MDLKAWFGGIDIYLFDQLLKGRLVPPMRVLDAGCGNGRNLVYFLRGGFEVFAVDQDPKAVSQVRQMMAELMPERSVENACVAEVEALPFDTAWFDAVISSAVLHFADDEAHFDRMIREMWRVLKPGGLFFARLASTIGLEDRVQALEGRRYRLPDGTERFLVDEAMLRHYGERLGGALLEPVKTTNVQNLRCMTTWCLGKERRGESS